MYSAVHTAHASEERRFKKKKKTLNAESPYRLLLQPTVMMRIKLNENEFATKLTRWIECARPEGKD